MKTIHSHFVAILYGHFCRIEDKRKIEKSSGIEYRIQFNIEPQTVNTI